MSLCILSVALIFSVFGWFYTSCILIPAKKEKYVLVATLLSAFINIVLNILLIPFFAQNAAAFTTVVAEFISFIICYVKSKNIIDVKFPKKEILLSFIGCIGIILFCIFISIFKLNIYFDLLIKLVGSIVIYGIIELTLKNETLIYFINILIKKIKND